MTFSLKKVSADLSPILSWHYHKWSVPSSLILNGYCLLMIPALQSFLIFEQLMQLMITMKILVTAFLLPVKLAQRILWHPFSAHRS